MLLADNYLQTAYIDSAVEGGIYYEYVIVAVDSDGNTSEYSAAVGATAATFDQGILIIDATPPDPGNPTIAEKEAFFAAIFAGFNTSYIYYDYLDDPLSKSLLGRYEVVFWIGDYSAGRLWNDATEEALRWYSRYNTALAIAGWRVAFELAGLKPDAQLNPGNLLYDLAGIDHFTEVYEIDYAGLVGENDFPDASLDPAKVYEAWSGKMGWIGTFGVDTTGEIIARFDSESGAYSDEIIGVRRKNGQSKFVFLSTPFYYLKDDGARNIVASVLGWFGRPIPCDCTRIGDCTGDGRIGPADVVYLVGYVLRQSGKPPQNDLTCPVVNRGDFDCDGVTNIADIVKLVNYVYRSPALGPCNPCDN